LATVVLLTAARRGPHRGGPSARYRPGTGHPLAEALLRRGHDPVLWWDSPAGPLAACSPDLVVLRSLVGPQRGRAEAFEASGIRVVNSVGPHIAASDKAHQARVFVAAGIAHPATLKVTNQVTYVGKAVAKPRHGSGGEGVRLITLPGEWNDVGTDDLVQPLLAVLADYRVVVVGGEAVSWELRRPAPEDFRTNLAQGATAEVVQAISDAASELVVAAVTALGLEIAGVDLVMTEHGPVIIEVNAATTLYGATGAETERIAQLTAHYLDGLLSEG